MISDIIHNHNFRKIKHVGFIISNLGSYHKCLLRHFMMSEITHNHNLGKIKHGFIANLGYYTSVCEFIIRYLKLLTTIIFAKLSMWGLLLPIWVPAQMCEFALYDKQIFSLQSEAWFPCVLQIVCCPKTGSPTLATGYLKKWGVLPLVVYGGSVFSSMGIGLHWCGLLCF